MFKKQSKKNSPAFFILIIAAFYLSIFIGLLNGLLFSAHIYDSITVPLLTIIMVLLTIFFTWIIFKFNRISKYRFWYTTIIYTVYFIVSYFLLRQLTAHLIGFSPDFESRVFIFLINVIIIIGIPAAYYYLNGIFAELKKNKEEIEIKKNELENLKNQLSPHFLFNNLNNIYATIMIDKQIALDYTHKFSDMMRFYHYMVGKDLIPVEDEISYIENYLAIEKYKMGDRLRLNFIKQIDELRHQIPPFLLTPLIESAIERSQGLGALPFIEIILTIKNSKLKMEVFNSIPEKPGKIKKQILIDKVRNQVQFLYPNKHTFTVEKINNLEQTTLEIPL